MGIYLPNMEMPKEGSWVTLRVFPDGQCVLHSWCGNDFDFMERLTAASVQEPHGRLIDADALAEQYAFAQEQRGKDKTDYSNAFMNNGELCTEWWCVEDMLENAPTIVPPSGGKENE